MSRDPTCEVALRTGVRHRSKRLARPGTRKAHEQGNLALVCHYTSCWPASGGVPQGGRDFRDQLMPACVWRALNTKIPALPRFRRCASVMLALPVRASPPKQKSENQEKFRKIQCYDLPSNLYICAGAAKLLLATGALLIEKHWGIF